MLPVTLGRQEFEKEGNLRTFVLRVKGDDGSVHERTYKFNPAVGASRFGARRETACPAASQRNQGQQQRKI